MQRLPCAAIALVSLVSGPTTHAATSTLPSTLPSTGASDQPAISVAITGMHQGQFKGTSLVAGRSDEIDAYAFSVSQPYGATTPVLHLLLDAGPAPQLLEAAVTSEVLSHLVVYVRRPDAAGHEAVDSKVTSADARITGAALSIDTHHAPTIAVDLLLNNVSYVGGDGGPTAAPPAAMTIDVPTRQGWIIGDFQGRTSGRLPGVQGNPQNAPGIPLDSIALSLSVPGLPGQAQGGKPAVKPLMIVRHAEDDARIFANMQAANEYFSTIDILVFQPSRTNAQAPERAFKVEFETVCFVSSEAPISPACAGNGMMASGKSGSAGLTSGAGTGSSGGTPRVGRVGGLIPMTLQPNRITVTNLQAHLTASYDVKVTVQ